MFGLSSAAVGSEAAGSDGRPVKHDAAVADGLHDSLAGTVDGSAGAAKVSAKHSAAVVAVVAVVADVAGVADFAFAAAVASVAAAVGAVRACGCRHCR